MSKTPIRTSLLLLLNFQIKGPPSSPFSKNRVKIASCLNQNSHYLTGSQISSRTKLPIFDFSRRPFGPFLGRASLIGNNLHIRLAQLVVYSLMAINTLQSPSIEGAQCATCNPKEGNENLIFMRQKI